MRVFLFYCLIKLYNVYRGLAGDPAGEAIVACKRGKIE